VVIVHYTGTGLRVELAYPGADPFYLLHFHLEWTGKAYEGPGGKRSLGNLKRKRVCAPETGDDFPCSNKLCYQDQESSWPEGNAHQAGLNDAQVGGRQPDAVTVDRDAKGYRTAGPGGTARSSGTRD
jgi:hypothetical protein